MREKRFYLPINLTKDNVTHFPPKCFKIPKKTSYEPISTSQNIHECPGRGGRHNGDGPTKNEASCKDEKDLCDPGLKLGAGYHESKPSSRTLDGIYGVLFHFVYFAAFCLSHIIYLSRPDHLCAESVQASRTKSFQPVFMGIFLVETTHTPMWGWCISGRQ